ncbi:NlpC/P60 family protein [Erythrobacter sp. Alg231-14]|uniref:NlpC/P60 family protein n=1 Tax=Erythrobacter sp. Alg231-14 TaxID=1922225 RepID=UPI000D5621FD
MNVGAQFADAASQFLGTKFRLHGRDPSYGLDCVGLVCVSLQTIGREYHAPEGYSLRNTRPLAWSDFAHKSGFIDVTDGVLPGDVMMLRPGPAQQHLVIFENERSCIHAHAGLKRVVREPIAIPRACLAHWRLT